MTTIARVDMTRAAAAAAATATETKAKIPLANPRKQHGGGDFNNERKVAPRTWNALAARAATTTSPRERHVEGAVSVAPRTSRTRANGQLRSGVRGDLAVAEVFGDLEAEVFAKALFEAATDYKRSLNDVFNRVQV